MQVPHIAYKPLRLPHLGEYDIIVPGYLTQTTKAPTTQFGYMVIWMHISRVGPGTDILDRRENQSEPMNADRMLRV